MQIEEKYFKEYLMKHLRHNYEHNGKEEAERWHFKTLVSKVETIEEDEYGMMPSREEKDAAIALAAKCLVEVYQQFKNELKI